MSSDALSTDTPLESLDCPCVCAWVDPDPDPDPDPDSESLESSNRWPLERLPGGAFRLGGAGGGGGRGTSRRTNASESESEPESDEGSGSGVACDWRSAAALWALRLANARARFMRTVVGGRRGGGQGKEGGGEGGAGGRREVGAEGE